MKNLSEDIDGFGMPMKEDTVGDLGYSGDYNSEDLEDAITHLQYSGGQMDHINGEYDYPEETADVKAVDPEKILPSKSFKKPKGWLKQIPKEKWAEEFKKVYDRDFAGVLAAKESGELYPAIMINGDLGDGFGRAQLAHALGEKIPVARFKAKHL